MNQWVPFMRLHRNHLLPRYLYISQADHRCFGYRTCHQKDQRSDNDVNIKKNKKDRTMTR